MNYWKSIMTRRSSQELRELPSFQKTAYLLLPLILYFLVHDLVQVLLWGVLEGVLSLEGGMQSGVTGFLQENAYTVNGLINGLSILAGVGIIWQAVKGEILGAFEKRQIPSDPDRKRQQQKLISCFLLAALAIFASWGMNLLLFFLHITQSSSAYGETAAAQYGVNFWLGLVLYGLLSPIVEEAVFRGLVYNRLKRCFGYILALIVSSLLFGCYHGNMVQGIYGTVLGLLIAWCYEKYQSFWAPVLFHGIANVSVYLMTCLGGFSRLNGLAAAILFLGAVICIVLVRKTAQNPNNYVKNI